MSDESSSELAKYSLKVNMAVSFHHMTHPCIDQAQYTFERSHKVTLRDSESLSLCQWEWHVTQH